jgi:UDP-N-acetylglucosamine:LPS N-acetylglucosamine transferase
LAADDDRGLTAERRDEALVVPPIVLLDEPDLLARADAERELGLEPGRVNALVQVGAGSDAVDRTVERCLERLAAEPGVQVAALESSISRELTLPEGVVRIRDTYPMARYLRAFDLTVAAAGYNAFHELLHLGVPTLFVPMPRELDDQEARARYAETAGVALACESPGSERLEAVIGQMLDPDRRARMSARAAAIGLGNGAEEAARLLSRLAVAGRSELEGLPRPSGGRIAMWSTMAQARLSALLRHPFERGRDGIRSR